MIARFPALALCCCVLLGIPSSDAFVPLISRPFISPVNRPLSNKERGSRLYFFGRNKEDDAEKKKSSDSEEEGEEKKSSFFAPFFNRKQDKEEEKQASLSDDNSSSSTTAAITNTAVKERSPVATAPPPPPVEQLSPQEQANKLRAEAEKARLEAERMDAELTLTKIERLEKQLAEATKHTAEDDSDSTSGKKNRKEDLQRELDALLNKVRGGPSSSTEAASHVASSSSSATSKSTKATTKPLWPDYIEPADEEELKEWIGATKIMPNFLRGAFALSMELDIDEDLEEKDMIEAIAKRADQRKRGDFSYSDKPPPVFTSAQIAEREALLKEKKEGFSETSWPLFDARRVGGDIPVDTLDLTEDRFKDLRDADDYKKLAQITLEYEYYCFPDESEEEAVEKFVMLAQKSPFLSPLLQNINFTDVDRAVESLYPKCLTKMGADVDAPKQPSEAQVQQLIAEVLPKVGFKATSKPESVLGGYIVRGLLNADDNDAFIEKLDKAMESAGLADKMSAFYTTDLVVLADSMAEDDIFFDASDIPPILFITAPDICRESKPFQLSIVTGLGIATSWYLSLYPFLLNSNIAARVDEQLALADASMAPDLAWLTDLSLPLFASFIGIQLVHELAHLVVAGANGIKTSPPTFVPSIITGITSTVTSLKSPPKNNNAMFDFAIAGPLAGMIASILAIVVGAQFTTISDPAMFPALPLEILRQSTLGGGIIENIIGGGILGVPEGALGTAAVASMNVPLHPVAVAGYMGLVVNALAVLPIGTTDGGRAAMALFGRNAKILIGSIFAFATLVVGLVGSDLFLFYFAFFTAFQTGNEIPSRNEVDKVDLPRVFLATAIYVLAALALVPFQ